MKMHLRFITAGLIIGLALPVVAQEQNTVDPEVRQQIEALIAKQDEAFNKNDAAGCTADYAQDAVEVLAWETAGGAASIIGPNDSLAPVRQNVYPSLGS
jgi:hypothetical protein